MAAPGGEWGKNTENGVTPGSHRSLRQIGGLSILTMNQRTTCLLDSAGNFTGTQTPGTNVHMAGGPINDRLHALHIGLPSPIGTSVGVGNLNPEGDALVAELTFSHPLHLLAVYTYLA